MASINWTIIAITLFLSCISFVFYVVSISTDNWINASAILTEGLESDVNYGLFSGNLDRHQLAATLRFDLRVTCDFSENACMYSCQQVGTERHEELQRILRGEELRPCEQARSVNVYQLRNNAQNDSNSLDLRSSAGDQYMPAALWLCTAIFLILSIIFTVTAGAFELINLHMNPIEPILNVFGLYVWNGCAAICSLLALSFWGGLYEDYLSSNIAITDTLRQVLTFSSAGRTEIGFSYYMVLLGLLMNIVNVMLLFFRSYIISRQNVLPTITIEQNDAPLQFY